MRTTTLSVLGLTVVMCSALVLVIRVVGGAPTPRWTYAVGPLVGALLWPLITVLLQGPQRPRHAAER